MRIGALKRKRSGTLRGASADDAAHLAEFARTHPGCEAYVEPRTAVTEMTVVLVAATGEWTRRRVAGPDKAAALTRKLGVPLYDAGRVGYPQRMRDWTAAHRT